MKNLNVTAILLFVLVLAACSSEAGKKQPKLMDPAMVGLTCVERILLMDDSLGTVRNHACENISLSETINNYVSGMESLDYDGCSQLFSQAYKQHMDAWKAMIPVTNKHPEIRGEMHDLFDQLAASPDSAVFSRNLKRIQDSWALVEQLK
jgi:hypothetical protein